MRIASTILMITTLVVFSACSSNKKNGVKENVMTVKVEKLTQQDNYPGVESNLKKTRNYNVAFSADIKEEITITHLLVDSIQIPITSLKIDGEVSRNENYTLIGAFPLIELITTRSFYNSSSLNPMVEEVQYELSGQTMEDGQASLQIDHFGKMKTIPLGSITVLESMYYP